MDGTLIDTEPYWMDAEADLVASFGGTWTKQDGLKLVGNGLPVSARILQEAGVELEVDEIIERLTDAVTVRLGVERPYRPGAVELVTAVRQAGIPIALVTMSMRQMALDAVGSLGFDVVVAGDDVARPKPYPDAYEQAAQALGVDPAECIAVEDSPTGVASALAAGTHVIGVEHMLSLDGTGAHDIWHTLAGRTLADLVASKNAGSNE